MSFNKELKPNTARRFLYSLAYIVVAAIVIGAFFLGIESKKEAKAAEVKEQKNYTLNYAIFGTTDARLFCSGETFFVNVNTGQEAIIIYDSTLVGAPTVKKPGPNVGDHWLVICKNKEQLKEYASFVQ